MKFYLFQLSFGQWPVVTIGIEWLVSIYVKRCLWKKLVKSFKNPRICTFIQLYKMTYNDWSSKICLWNVSDFRIFHYFITTFLKSFWSKIINFVFTMKENYHMIKGMCFFLFHFSLNLLPCKKISHTLPFFNILPHNITMPLLVDIIEKLVGQLEGIIVMICCKVFRTFNTTIKCVNCKFYGNIP